MSKSEIRKVKIGDEKILANIHITSWQTAFDKILSNEILDRMTDIKKTETMYKYLLENNIGNGVILSVNNKPHCITFWDKTREKDMQGYAELICIHSLSENWGKGYGSMIMEYVLNEIKKAGFTDVMLWVFKENTRARKFYEKNGFILSQKTKTSFDTVEVMYIKNLSF